MTQDSLAATTMSTEEMQQFVYDYTQAVCTSDVAALVTFKAPDAISASGQEPGRVMTPEELNAYIEERQWSFPDFKFEASNIIVSPRTGLATFEWKVSGHFLNPFKGIPPNGNLVTQHGTTELQIEDKQIVRETSYQDMNAFMAQLMAPPEEKPASSAKASS
jgi:steroid delta-isomerase-like uncharacterized protein